MGIIGWAVVGFVAAVIAGWLTGRRGGGCITHIVVGVIGGLIGGALDRWNGGPGINHFGLRSILVAAIGATIFLAVLNAIGSGRLRR
ncbi:MAG TPA: GlsB/YeaQ/YmgE family stress response membrane protein [Acidimicrobiales bacterium]|nr:GlsB/YeaQ/YmgE family stress response membrane protein [Acidimicrobiales bacterium]